MRVSLGKVDYYNKGRKINEVILEFKLDYNENNRGKYKYVFRASACVKNSRGTGCLISGQCLDELARIPAVAKNDTFKLVYQWWKRYHLNDMHAGTYTQEQALNKLFKAKPYADYDEQCKYLQDNNLLIVSYRGKPYRYGSSWLYKPIPIQVVNNITKLMADLHKEN